MSFRTVSLLAFATLSLVACKSAPSAPCADTQAIVEATAKDYPAVTRLTVHTVPPTGGASVAVASTWAEKLGKPSDPEDLKAMTKGETVVLQEVGAVDVTVPICKKDGKFTAAAGITFKSEKGTDQKQLVELANAIAKVLEDKMAAAKK